MGKKAHLMKWVFENIDERLEMLKILALVNTTSNKFMFVFLIECRIPYSRQFAAVYNT